MCFACNVTVDEHGDMDADADWHLGISRVGHEHEDALVSFPEHNNRNNMKMKICCLGTFLFLYPVFCNRGYFVVH